MWQKKITESGGGTGCGSGGFPPANRTKCVASVNCHFAISSIKNAKKNKNNTEKIQRKVGIKNI